MNIHDVSLPIGPDLPIWPGNPPVEIRANQRIIDGDPANVSELRLGTHTGTHVDPPLHFLEGEAGIDRVALDALVGPCDVVDARGLPGPLGPEELEPLIPAGAERVLLRTDNSELWRRLPIPFPAAYTALSAAGAAFLVRAGVRLVGTDFLSIETRGAPGHPVHTALLGAGVVIVEGLDLSAVEPGRYTLVVLPLRLVDGDGSPARAVLIED
ncbi:MAG TPA: cyclase family protein [Actinomycetota bacterium]|nr:cyclase family protein [Actinomycetota bacterium]